IDSRGLYRERRAAAAIADATLRRLLTQHFGVAWVPRADGQGHEIKGVSQEVMDRFSARRRSIKAEAKKVAELREQEWERAPSAWQMDRIQRDITFRTRQGKPDGPLNIPGLLHDGEAQAAAADLDTLEPGYDPVLAGRGAARARGDAVLDVAQ